MAFKFKTFIAIKMLGSYGFNLRDHKSNIYGKGIFIYPSVKYKTSFINPFRIIVNEDDLNRFYKIIKHSGFTGVKFAKALADAVYEFDEQKYQTIMNDDSGLVSHEEFIMSFFRYIMNVAESRRINITGINPYSIKNIMSAVGGYKNMKAIFKDAINYAYGINEIFMSKCLTCKHCKVDANGNRYCYDARVSIPNTKTYNDLLQYPKMESINGKLWSPYLIHGIDIGVICNRYTSRDFNHLKSKYTEMIDSDHDDQIYLYKSTDCQYK